MNIKLTVYLTILLAIGIILVIFVVNPGSKQTIMGKQIKGKRVFNMSGGSIKKIEMRNNHGNFIIRRNKHGGWSIISPVIANADKAIVSTIINGVKTLNYERQIGSGTLSAFGLSPASITATVTLSDKRFYRLEIGGRTPVGQYYYAKAGNGTPGIFTITNWIRNRLNDSLFQIRDKSVISLSRNNITSISFVKNSRPIYILKKSNGVWAFEKPSYNRIKVPVINGMLFRLTNLTADNIIDNISNLKNMGLEKPSEIISIGMRNNKLYNIKIGKDAGRNKAYATVTGQKPVYVINKTILPVFDKSPDNMIDNRLLIQSKWAVSSIEIILNGKAVMLTKKSYGKWYKNGVKFTDTGSINKLFDSLTSINAEKFISSTGALKHAALTFTIIGTMPPTTTTLSFGSGKDKVVYAKTSIDPRVAVLNAGAVDALKTYVKRIY